jgi:hypothetical protein
MASQLSTLKRKRPQYNYVDAINAQASSLPDSIRNKQIAAMQAESAQLDRDSNTATMAHLKSQEALGNKQFALMKDQVNQQKKDAKTAEKIGIAKLGLDTAFTGFAASKGKFGGGSPGSGVRKGSAIKALPSKIGKFLAPNQKLGALTGPGALGKFSKSLNLSNIGIGGGAGALTAAVLPDKWKKNTLKRTVAGAAAGAAANYLKSGGDLFDTAVGGVFGGGAGFLNFF